MNILVGTAEEKNKPKLVVSKQEGISHACRSFDIICDWVFEDEAEHKLFP
jgi:hypothetical protein